MKPPVDSHFFLGPLGVTFKNEDMVAILQQFHSYLPHIANSGYESQTFAGGQLIVERAVNVISSVAYGYSPEDRLEGITLQLGDWHAAAKNLSVSLKLNFI